MKRRVILLVTAIVLMSLVVVSGLGAAPFFQKTLPPAQTTSAMPPVIVVSGSNYEMGYQYGTQAADLIYHNVAITKGQAVARYGEETVDNDQQVWAYYADQYDPDIRDWLEGIRAGCRAQGYRISYNDLILLTIYPCEMWARPNTPYPEETGYGYGAIAQASANPAGEEEYHSCTAFAATGNATPDGKPLVAITKMVPMDVMNSIILIAIPDEGISWIANPYAGATVQNSGMNSAGLAWIMTALGGGPGGSVWGLASEFYFHYLNQYCESPEEAREYLETTPRAGVTGGFLMSDGAGDISAFECSHNDSGLRFPGDDGETGEWLVETNGYVHPDMQYLNWPGYHCFRYATAWALIEPAAASSTVDFDFAKALYASDDWYDDVHDVWHYNDPGSRNLNNSFPGSVAQSIFFPADLTAYFEVGTPSGIGLPGGATGEYVKVELADNPAAITGNVKSAAWGYYAMARNLFVRELNDNAPYLTYLVAESIRALLDEAMLEYERGMDREGFATLASTEGHGVRPFKLKREQMALWSEALTHYASAQLYAQMVITQLENMAP